ncbi:SH3 domain-containing protein [Ruminiclostridium papyrosolvens]|uniref:SH3b domain-containing protein n=1 Tax=Ruminiclostridium papyrosolvens C7 TaxID=1330534 RepID=U4QZ23_9FIRM|nr:SH3 domain-containing protein [Ruminiclostridium papyrosolvens]EPR10201.1 hypothetical protein L323_14290 [Ruminiclostridium papyrosolvens C7]
MKKLALVLFLVFSSLCLNVGIVSANTKVDVSASSDMLVTATSYKYYFVVVEAVAVRKSPSTSSTRLGLLYGANEDYVTFSSFSSDGNWVYGTTSTGITGYVSLSCLEGCNSFTDHPTWGG